MRRKDKEITDAVELVEVLDSAEWGTLGLVSADGQAVMVPLNFAYQEGKLLFHSSPEGQKMGLLKANNQASFLVVEAFSLIPSYVSDPVSACSATQCFKSVIAYGRIDILEDPVRKANALEAIMKKLQPEGRYEAIRADDPHYQPRLKATAVLEMSIERLSGKFSFGQKFAPERRKSISDFLRTRCGAQDVPTADAMQRFAPDDRNA